MGLIEEHRNFVQPVQNDDRNHLSWKRLKKDILRETMSLHLSEIGKKLEIIMGKPVLVRATVLFWYYLLLQERLLWLLL